MVKNLNTCNLEREATLTHFTCTCNATGAIERNGLAPGANQRKMFDSEQVTLPKPVHVASIEALELFEEPKQDGDKAKEVKENQINPTRTLNFESRFFSN